jgi:L-lysine epsilon oxidase-like protein
MTDPIPPCFDCATMSTERLVEMFVGMVQKRRIALGQKPAQRPVFRKLHGVAHARFEVAPGLPRKMRVGIFAHDKLDAWLRFSSDTSPTDPDLQSTLGIGIKLYGVPGRNALGEMGDTADFIMQNFPVFFVDTAKDMCEFTYAGVVGGNYDPYLATHPKTAKILKEMAKVEGSVLTTTYWAILPFRLGGEFVKYRLDPETDPQNVPDDSVDYLATDMENRLAEREYRFRLMIQRRTDPARMPLDRATVEWPVSESRFIHAATLVIPRQDIGKRGQGEYGQDLAYNIWRVPEENAPAEESSIAVVRREVYKASADVRHTANGQTLEDPAKPRPEHVPPPPKDTCIVKAAIYPSIGVCRVGNAEKDFFIGPEVPDPPIPEPGFYRDKRGALKRQAARFRIYGVNAKGEIVRELTGARSKAKIAWSAHLANTKAAWFTFQLALDIPEAADAPQTTLRNPAVPDRDKLAIVPSRRKVSGANARPKKFDDGKFMDKPVYLGEIFTDKDSRLIVLGGHGKSTSFDHSRAITFANNDGWHDDVSDGPVTAEVELDGMPLEVVPAWVIVAPPDYGPRRKSVRTMWDLMRDVAIQAGTLPKPTRPSFRFDILPIFERMSGLQWVNAGFAAGFGWKSAFDFTTPDWIARLGDNRAPMREIRRVLKNNFRHDDVDSWSPVPWPWLYGDAMNVPAAHTPRQNASLSDTQLAMLEQWAEGDFEADYDPAYVPPKSIDEVPLEAQGETLTRAALEFCLADAFHPGCEMTWPVRTATMYMAPYRFAHAPDGWVPPGMGEILTSDTVTIPNGPLYGQQPGTITRWMAVPWQTDTASCRSGYEKQYDPYVPSFWPARVPNQVLTEQNYDIVMDKTKPMEERRAAFANRAAWIAPLGNTSYTDQINNMIRGFWHLGVVQVQKGPSDTDAFPKLIEVEDQHIPIPDEAAKEAKAKARFNAFKAAARGSAPPVEREVDVSGIEKVRRFPGGLLHRRE